MNLSHVPNGGVVAIDSFGLGAPFGRKLADWIRRIAPSPVERLLLDLGDGILTLVLLAQAMLYGKHLGLV
jgi:hypothetical protein